jgi:hypothetical protein
MAWREHALIDQECWCSRTYPVTVNGEEVGRATPLEDGNYSIAFNDDEAGQEAQTKIVNGFPDFIIEEPIQGELFTTEEAINES